MGVDTPRVEAAPPRLAWSALSRKGPRPVAGAVRPVLRRPGGPGRVGRSVCSWLCPGVKAVGCGGFEGRDPLGMGRSGVRSGPEADLLIEG